MQLFDTHTHIQSPEFDGDRDATLDRARQAGLEGQLVLGWDVPSSEQAIAIAEQHEDVLAAAGCHPHSAKEMDDASLAALVDMARHPRVAAVGEIGLDFYRNLSERSTQIDVLERQLEAAVAVDKPVAVHGRDAHETLLPIIESWSRDRGGRLSDGRPLGVLHYFDGDVELGQRYVELGFLISINTAVTRPKETRLHEVVRALPLETLVVETDSPYGAPQSRRSKRNEPAYLGLAVEAIAELRGEPADTIAEATTNNALRLFAAAHASAGTERSASWA